MENNKEHKDLVDKVYAILLPVFGKDSIFIEGRCVGYIQIFDKSELKNGEMNRFKIARSDIMVFDDEGKPLLVVEPETSSSPKTFGRSIPIYTIAKRVIIKSEGKVIKSKKIESPLLLLIVIPEQKANSQKDVQLPDVENKIKMNVNTRDSNIKDFAICESNDLMPTLRRLFNNSKYSRFFD
jgi:hypothetical protein